MMSFSCIWELSMWIKYQNSKCNKLQAITNGCGLIIPVGVMLCSGDEIGLNFIIFCSNKSVVVREHGAGTVSQLIFNCILPTAVYLLVFPHTKSPHDHSVNSNCWVHFYSVIQYLNFIQIFHKIITIYNYIQHWCWIVSIVLHQVS